jgi:glycosyltransferase involved in cell wall biosynthesis
MAPRVGGQDGGVRVSVVIPVRDDARHLEVCLRSLARQTVPPDEVVVVDNGSSDDSVAVALAAGARVLHQPVVGIAAAASTGYDGALGDLVGRCDADSVLPRTWVAELSRTFDERPDVVAVSTGARFYDAPVGLQRILSLGYVGAYHVLVGAGLAHWPLFGSTMMMRRSAWEAVRADVHRRDVGLHDDMDLAVHLGDLVLGQPGRIVWRRDVVTAISARPFARGGRQWLRSTRAVRSFAVHGRDGVPFVRWWRRDPFSLRAGLTGGGSAGARRARSGPRAR